MKRFIVKKVKIVWRNSMLVGNPIERSFTKFGVFDRNWESDRYCCCPQPDGEFATNNGQWQKYRVIVDDEAVAKKIAEKLESLLKMVPGIKQIDFNGLNSWICDDETIEKISINKVEC